jgi:hypothetical protein
MPEPGTGSEAPKGQPTGEHNTGSGVAFPTSDLPGTDHPDTAKPQAGVKGMEPKSETGTPAESKPSK